MPNLKLRLLILMLLATENVKSTNTFHIETVSNLNMNFFPNKNNKVPLEELGEEKNLEEKINKKLQEFNKLEMKYNELEMKYNELERAKSEKLDIKPEELDIKSEKLDIKSEELDIKSEELDIKSEKLDKEI